VESDEAQMSCNGNRGWIHCKLFLQSSRKLPGIMGELSSVPATAEGRAHLWFHIIETTGHDMLY
jgi:hypothetical protein